MRTCVFFNLIFFMLLSAAFAQGFLSPDILKSWLDSGKPVIIVDIQSAEGYAENHLRGSIETDAYPAETDGQMKRLGIVVPTIMLSQNDVVIVRPPAKAGRVAAIRVYKYLMSKGVSENRLSILDGGIDAWPYADMLEKGRQ